MAPKRKRKAKAAVTAEESTDGTKSSSKDVVPEVADVYVEESKPGIDTVNGTESGKAMVIPDGRPKSGRHWKSKQTTRTSMDKKKGVMSRMRKSYETHKQEREKNLAMKLLENEMKAEKQEKKAQEKSRKEERERRRKENEFKTSSFQQINGEKLKKMSKKQLKNIAKTSMSKSGALELVPAYK